MLVDSAGTVWVGTGEGLWTVRRDTLVRVGVETLNAPVTAASLRKAGVRAVAWLAGELGTEIAGERRTDAELTSAGFPSRLFVMPRVAHLYPDEMDDLMRQAFEFVLAHEHEPDGGAL